MLTAHQRIAIRARLPEVVEIHVREDRDPIDLSATYLVLADDSEIVIYSSRFRKCRRTRLRGDYSDNVDILRIDTEMRERLTAIFGPLDFGEHE